MSTKDRREQEKENRRQVILDAAEAIMQANGIHGLNVDLIAHETQLAKGTIYLYFKSKEEILATLTLKARNLLFKAFKEAVSKHDSPIEQLKSVVYANHQFYQENPLLNDLVSLYEVNSQLVETIELQEASDNITKMIVEIAQKAKENGTLNPNINPLHFTIILWGMTMGVHQVLKIRGKGLKENLNISEQNVLDEFVQFIDNGMKT